MKLKVKDGVLKIETTIFQGRTGGVFLDFGNTVIKLEKMYAEIVARDIPDFNNEDFNNFYSNQ